MVSGRITGNRKSAAGRWFGKSLVRDTDNSVPRAQNSRKAEEVRNCLTDEGRPLGVGLQEQAPNHLRRLWPKATVVNAGGKGSDLPGQVTGKKRTAKEPLLKCRKLLDDGQNRSL
jgi:hypothetical protein